MSRDPRQLLARSLDLAGGVIAGVGGDQWNLATPCTEYNVTELTEHLVGAIARPGFVVDGGELEGETALTGTVPPDGFAEAFSEARAATLTAFEDDGVLDTEFTMPSGTFTGGQLAIMYAMEAAVHSWDLAVATGQDDKLDDETAADLLPAAKQFLPPDARGGDIPFGPVVVVSDDARPADALAAYLGRSRPGQAAS